MKYFCFCKKLYLAITSLLKQKVFRLLDIIWTGQQNISATPEVDISFETNINFLELYEQINKRKKLKAEHYMF